MAKQAPNVAAHLEWLGFVRPTGLVVSAPALASAGAIFDRRDTEAQRRLRDCAAGGGPAAAVEPQLPDFRTFVESVLDWNFSPRAYAGTDEAPIPPELEAALPESGTVLRPDYAVRSERLTNPLRPAPASTSTVRQATPATPPRESVPAGAVREPTPAPTAGPTSRPTASSYSTTRLTRTNGAPARGPTSIAGPTRSATRSSPASWNAERAAEEIHADTAAPAARPEAARPPGRPAHRRSHASRLAETRPLWGPPDD